MSTPILRRCICGCRRTFTVPFPSVEKQYYDRTCSNRTIYKPKPRHYAGARGISRVRAPREYALSEAP